MQLHRPTATSGNGTVLMQLHRPTGTSGTGTVLMQLHRPTGTSGTDSVNAAAQIHCSQWNDSVNAASQSHCSQWNWHSVNAAAQTHCSHWNWHSVYATAQSHCSQLNDTVLCRCTDPLLNSIVLLFLVLSLTVAKVNDGFDWLRNSMQSSHYHYNVVEIAIRNEWYIPHNVHIPPPGMWHRVVRRSFPTCRVGDAPVFRVNYPTTLRHIHSHRHVNLISHAVHVNNITAVAWSHLQLYLQPCARREALCGNGCVDPRIFSFCTRWRWVVGFTQWPRNPREGSGFPLRRRSGGPHSWSWRLEKKSLPLPEIERRFLGRTAHSPVAVPA